MKPENLFLQEECRCGFLVTETVKKVWGVELDLLQKILNVCDKHNLRIFADAGTLLGAVRHHGFIPWDDDIDMVMFRSDYDKLIAVGDREFQHPYHLQSWIREEGFFRGHAQLRNSETTGILECEEKYQFPFDQGIFLDIFVLDAVPEKKEDLIRLQKRIHRLKRDLKWITLGQFILREEPGGLRHRIENLLRYYIFGRGDAAQKCKRIETLLRENPLAESDCAAPLMFIFDTNKRIRNKHLYDKTVWMDFEYMKIPVPEGYHEYLTNRYGDYRKPVQVPTSHGGVIFHTEISYKDYFKLQARNKK